MYSFSFKIFRLVYDFDDSCQFNYTSFTSHRVSKSDIRVNFILFSKNHDLSSTIKYILIVQSL